MSTTETLEVPFDGKKLFSVEIEQTVFVFASDEEEATDIAK
jgi:hypothetical protein